MGNARCPEYFQALNLVEIEFYDDAGVEKARQEVFAQLNTQATPETAAKWDEDRQEKTTRLLHRMGEALGFDLQQLDLLKGGYAPKWLTDMLTEQQEARSRLIEVLRGDKPIRVRMEPPETKQ